MELPSGRFSASGKSRLIPAAPDHLGALPDDLLLIVLAHLRCIATAGRTSILARRWRGLWTHLHALIFRDMPLTSMVTVLDALRASSTTPAAAGKVSLLDIRVADPDQLMSTRRVTSLLSSAARFLPEELFVAVPLGVACLRHPVHLPSFDRATSISLSMGNHPAELRLPPLPATNDGCLFPVLTTVVLSGYYISGGLANLVAHSPHLRVLKYTVRCPWSTNAITVQSRSLQELVVEVIEKTNRIDIATPMLKKLTMSYYAADGDDLTVSVVAPMAEEVLWHCRYGNARCPGWYTVFGCWELVTVIFMTGSSALPPRPPSPPLLRIDARTGPSSFDSADEFDDYLEQQVEKHMVAADLSVVDLELLLTPFGHVYGALVLHIPKMRRVCTALRMLKLRLLIPKNRCREAEGCHEDCSCEPTDWRSQTISLPRLEEVEINGFQGANNEFDFLDIVFRCAPMLRRMTVKQSIEAPPSDAKILAIFKTHPCVECYVLSSPC